MAAAMSSIPSQAQSFAGQRVDRVYTTHIWPSCNPRCRDAFRNFPLTVAMAGHGKFFVGGNWKCNGTTANVKELVSGLNAGSWPTDEVEVVVAPPYPYLAYVKEHLRAPYELAGQNCWVKKTGAFTGEVAPCMLKDLGVDWVILGHSERRSFCGETNEVVGAKVKNAMEDGLSVIACIGETLQQREAGEMFTVLDAQLQAIVDNVVDWDRAVIAYEPVWAIGTGAVATPAQAQEVHGHLREVVKDKVGAGTADKVRLLYGGSVNEKNCQELATQPDVDGFLVGGASLVSSAFISICNAARAVATA